MSTFLRVRPHKEIICQSRMWVPQRVGKKMAEWENGLIMEERGIGLTNSEWVVMESLWGESPKTATQLIKVMEEETGWAKSTTKTVLRRMEQKGYISYREGEKAREYYPKLKREEVVESETSHFLNRIYNGSLGLLVNTLVKKQDIPDEEMEELYRIIKEAKEKKNEGKK